MSDIKEGLRLLDWLRKQPSIVSDEEADLSIVTVKNRLIELHDEAARHVGDTPIGEQINHGVNE